MVYVFWLNDFFISYLRNRSQPPVEAGLIDEISANAYWGISVLAGLWINQEISSKLDWCMVFFLFFLNLSFI